MKADKQREEELLANIKHSTDNALKALVSLEQNLIRGRFKEGIDSYDLMCKTLVGQKLWSVDKNITEIDNNFKQLADTAKRIIQILQPYINSLNKLLLIEKEVQTKNTERSEQEIEYKGLTDDQAKLVNLINNFHRQEISYTKLRAMLGWEKKRLDSVLQSFNDRVGEITVIKVGSRRFIRKNNL